ncbi:hypothetical protein ACU4GD_17595 [Cupriavidus basilensis]
MRLAPPSSAAQNWKFQVNRSSFDTGVRSKFETGPVRHALALQANLGYMDRIANANVSGTLRHVEHLRPRRPAGAGHRPAATGAQGLRLHAVGPVAGRHLERARRPRAVDPWLALPAGQVEQLRRHRRKDIRLYDESAVTPPEAGIVFKPWQNVSLYANYVEGLSKGDIAPATACRTRGRSSLRRTRPSNRR